MPSSMDELHRVSRKRGVQRVRPGLDPRVRCSSPPVGNLPVRKVALNHSSLLHSSPRPLKLERGILQKNRPSWKRALAGDAELVEVGIAIRVISSSWANNSNVKVDSFPPVRSERPKLLPRNASIVVVPVCHARFPHHPQKYRGRNLRRSYDPRNVV